MSVSPANTNLRQYLFTHDVSTRSIAPNQAATVQVDLDNAVAPNVKYDIRFHPMGLPTYVVTLPAVPNFLPSLEGLLL